MSSNSENNPIFDLLKGFFKSFLYIFKPKVTIRYPKQKSIVSDKFRGKHYLLKNIDGTERCIACKLCEAVCPARAIKVEGNVDDKGQNRAGVYQIDVGKCCYCGLCVEACPVGAINMSKVYEDISFSDNKIILKETLLKRGEDIK